MQRISGKLQWKIVSVVKFGFACNTGIHRNEAFLRMWEKFPTAAVHGNLC